MEEEKKNNGCHLPPRGPTPWLVYTHGNSKSKKFQTFCTISSSPPYTNHYFKSIPELRGKTIFYSNDGWLLLRDLDNLKIFTVWNPISCQLINLPPMNALDGVHMSCALVCPPREHSDPRDVSVFVFGNGVAFSYRPCRDGYMWISCNTKLVDQRAVVRSAVICNDIIYGFVDVRSDSDYCIHRHSVIIEVSNHGTSVDGSITIRAIEAEVPHPEFFYSCSKDHLLLSCGRVYYILINLRNIDDNRICAIIIWELDSSLTKWVQIKDLGGRAFFLGDKGCTWCWGSNESGGVKQNSVYFEVAQVDGFGAQEAMYMYNLEDCSLTSLLPCPNLQSPWYAPVWVMPQYQRLVRDEAHVQCIQKVEPLEQGFQEQTAPDTQHGSLIDTRESSNTDNQKETKMLDQISLLCELPLDVIVTVAQKMHLFDYLNFRSTCKQFRSITPIARWRTNNLYPLFLFFESELPLCSLMDPCRSDSCCMVIPELFRGVVHIDFSIDGWLLLRTNKGSSLHFFNPFTKVVGKFPPSERIRGIESVGFSSCPTSPDCVTVGISCVGFVKLYYHRFGEEKWSVLTTDLDNDVHFKSLLSSPVYHKGAFYFLDIKGSLGMCSFVGEDVYWDTCGKPQTLEDDTFHSNHLVECDGELLSVFIGLMGKWVRVFRFYEKDLNWVRVKSLGNYVLFVSPTSSYSMVANEPEMGNRIYLPRRRGKEIIFYSLDTGKYGTHMGEESFEDFVGTNEPLRCACI